MIELYQKHENKIVKTYQVSSYAFQNSDCIELDTVNFGKVILSRIDNPDIWDQMINSAMAETPYTMPIDIYNEAKIALDKSDMVALRCVKSGIIFPPEWQQYVAELRAVISGNLLSLPVQPVYPKGS